MSSDVQIKTNLLKLSRKLEPACNKRKFIEFQDGKTQGLQLDDYFLLGSVDNAPKVFDRNIEQDMKLIEEFQKGIIPDSEKVE